MQQTRSPNASPASRPPGRLWPGALLITVLALILWRFPLFAHRSIAHGDSLVFGWPLIDLAGRIYQGKASALWASGIYGGHPIFAEGQGGFASPLTILTSLIVTPLAGSLYALNFFLFTTGILAGIGVLGLCRQLGLSRWAGSFAALAAVFSPFWLGAANNPAWVGSFLWIPWALWAMERWLAKPDGRAALFLGTSCAAMVLAGYAPALHGTMIYMVLCLLTLPFDEATRRGWAATWRQRCATGAGAVLLCVGLSAIQWLPLLELAGQSHRQGGIGLAVDMAGRTGFFLRGAFWEGIGPAQSIGSPLVFALALAALFTHRSPRLRRHIIATIVVYQLGWGNGSALFRFLYDHHVIPGLDHLRIFPQFNCLATIGMAVAAGSAIDSLSFRWAVSHRLRITVLPLGFCLGALWLWGALALHSAVDSYLHLAIACAAAVIVPAMALFRRFQFIPPSLLFLLTVECGLRLTFFPTLPDHALHQPDVVTAGRSMGDWADFKTIDLTPTAAYGALGPRHPTLAASTENALATISSFTAILWDMKSINADLALPLARHEILVQPMADEIAGVSPTPPGSRLIDILGVRLISATQPPPESADIAPWYPPWAYENKAALPRFQGYAHHVSVDSPDAALAAMRSWSHRTLVIENPSGAAHQFEPPDASSDEESAPLQIEIIKAKDSYYHLRLQADHAAWLFLADANYPGWHAYLDGKRVPLFSAQVLGKAVAVPEGRHELALTFESGTFRWGALISALTLIATAAMVTLDRKQRIVSKSDI